MNTVIYQKPTKAFTLAALVSLIAGTGAYVIGLFNAVMELNEKG